MRLHRICAAVALLAILGSACVAYNHPAASHDDRTALQNTSEAIRAAFAKGDVATVIKYHHPDVNKALSFHKILVGRDAVAADLQDTFQHSRLEFVENRVESLLIERNTAVEQTLFTIRGIPTGGGEPFLFKGRAMVVYVRYPESPTGWASIREIIQPATD
jgi:ketosteroid isomerase-like protein